MTWAKTQTQGGTSRAVNMVKVLWLIPCGLMVRDAFDAAHSWAISALSEDVLTSLFSFLSRSPITISHVCSSWRNIVIASPSCWTTLSRGHSLQKAPVIEKLSAFLERSGTLPLTIDLQIGSYRVDEELCQEIMELMEPHAPRWRYFYFYTNNPECLCIAFFTLQRLSEDVPILEHLSVNASPNIHHSQLGWMMADNRLTSTVLPDESNILEDGAPSLRGFRTFGVASQFFLPPLSSITTLILRDPTPVAFTPLRLRQILKLRKLECLYIGGWFFAKQNLDQQMFRFMLKHKKPIVMKRLRHLNISGVNGPDSLLPILFSQIGGAPELQSIMLVDQVIPINLTEFATTSFPTVVQLKLIRCRLQRDDDGSGSCAPFLSMFPNTKYLSISTGDVPTDIMPYLTTSPPQSEVPVLPSLRMFTCPRPSRVDLDGLSEYRDCWREGLLPDPRLKLLRQTEEAEGWLEKGWFHDLRWPPNPGCWDEDLCTRGEEYFGGDI
ncbi:hypothetical protein BDN72DRAFT_904842 [Pluteus cervinus]|uniref:Uncharacterized protein n=1 Tax=Pluteus cervinus TaxID=181527 RepID=A0ACD3A4K6_9AGAR|nr:hypothetical protein BDN72DRAFT_904842 [Pluteus cervinus]